VVSLKRKRLKPGERVTLSLALDQVDLLTEETLIGENLLAMLYASKVYDNVVRVRCSLDDLDQLFKYVADEASNTKDNILQQKLDAISDAIRTLEQSYYGAPLRIVTSSQSAKSTELEIK
jgi:hypothetical protein